MKKLALAIAAVGSVAGIVGGGFAAFTDTASAQDNVFQAGTLILQVSQTDGNNDGIANGSATYWADQTLGAWTSPTNWAPGDVYEDRVFVRNAGTIDAQSVLLSLSGELDSDPVDGVDMAAYVNLTDAWFDQDGNGTRDVGEDILSSMVTAYDAVGNGGNGNGTTTLREIYDRVTSVPASRFELTSGVNVLPGSVTSPSLGGASGTGKALWLEWTFDSTAPNALQGDSFTVDFDFTGSNI